MISAFFTFSFWYFLFGPPSHLPQNFDAGAAIALSR